MWAKTTSWTENIITTSRLSSHISRLPELAVHCRHLLLRKTICQKFDSPPLLALNGAAAVVARVLTRASLLGGDHASAMYREREV